ncbi:theronine dehydrogenase, partial [Lactiplantibacillus plantarum]
KKAVMESRVSPGDAVLIQGAGPIGLFTALIAQISGAHHVIINDMSEERLDLANELGVQYPIRADSQKSLGHF